MRGTCDGMNLIGNQAYGTTNTLDNTIEPNANVRIADTVGVAKNLRAIIVRKANERKRSNQQNDTSRG